MTNYYISQILCKKAEVCSEPIQLFSDGAFSENSYRFAKSFIFDVLLASEYASVLKISVQISSRKNESHIIN